MGKYLNVIFFGLLLGIIENLKINTSYFDIPDKNWKETYCTPYNFFWANGKCILYDNQAYFFLPVKKCWVYQETGFFDKNKDCDIIFTQPLKSHIILEVLNVWSLFGFLSNWMAYKLRICLYFLLDNIQ